MLKAIAATAVALLFSTAALHAQQWPTRAVTLVVPLAAGGGSDGLVRVMAPRLGEVLGQSVIIENIGGVGGMIGSDRVAKAPPDGYRILLGTQGSHALNQTLYQKPLYNAATDFAPVGLVFDIPIVLMARKEIGAKSLQEFVSHARANQAKMQYGSSGVGGNGHLACALVNSAIGIEVTHIPFRGGGPAMTDLLGGRIDYICALANIAKPQIESGRALGIAVLSPERSRNLPNLPTAIEQGVQTEATSWNAIFLPKGTPGDIIARLNAAISTTLDTPAVRDQLIDMGTSITPAARRSPEYLQGFLQSEIKKWAAIIRTAGIEPQ